MRLHAWFSFWVMELVEYAEHTDSIYSLNTTMNASDFSLSH